MKKNIPSSFLLLIIGLFLVACAAKKKTVTLAKEEVKNTVTDKGLALNQLVKGQIDYNTFTTKAASKLLINGKEYDASLNIRIKKGELIWVSVIAFAGIEAARALITPDSIKVLDRVNDDYIKKPFSYINDYTNNDIDFATLEAMLVGNLIPLVLKNNDKIISNDETYLLKDKTANMFYEVSLNNDFKTQSLLFLAINNTQKLNASFTGYQKNDNNWLPSVISINSTAVNNKIDIKMEYSKPQLNLPLDFPFNVPKRFSTID